VTALALRGKRALVTGAGVRVGRAIALALGREGMHVAVHYRTSREDAEETCRLVRAAGGEAVALGGDLSDRDVARAVVDESVTRLGGLDLLVPNAAGFERVTWPNLDDGAWDRMLDLNLTASFVLAERAATALGDADGSIVFITCASATVPYRNYLPYVVSKGGLRHLMRVLALELAPRVRVNAVAPGTVLPPDGMAQEDLDRMRARVPLGRFGDPEDVADAVVFLARSPFITGHEIHVDGGRTIAGFERLT
jgi:pteridine reductase